MATGKSKTQSSDLPLKEIPGGYGIPIIGPILDRIQYFYGKGGRDAFFHSRITKYGSTVFRTNMPPGPFNASDPRVIALLDAASFPVLFDNTLLEKKDVFFGTFMPSPEFTGGYRILSYHDTTEPSHALLKQLLFFMLSYRHQAIFGEFSRTFGEMFEGLEAEIEKKGKAGFNSPALEASFNFLARGLLDKDPKTTQLGSDTPKLFTVWVAAQMAPILSLGSPWLAPIEELLIHTFPVPPILVKSSYKRLAAFIRDAAGPVLDEAERLGIEREEAVHNLTFAVCFNSLGGMKIFYPSILKWIGLAGEKLHAQLAQEVRAAMKAASADGGSDEAVMMKAIGDMPLVRSVVYETLRIEPPVPYQYGRARKDFEFESHDARYKVKKGEMLFGFQPIATKDPRVFDRAEEFVGDRFVGEEGEKLLRYVYWSNGRETEKSTTSNKQCAGKDFIVLVGRLLVVEMFMRYDSFEVEVKASALGADVTLKALKKKAAPSSSS